MATINTFGKNTYNVQSGKTVGIVACMSGWTPPPGKGGQRQKPRLMFVVSEGEGEINERGIFKAPVTSEDQTTKVTVALDDGMATPETIEITIKGEPLMVPSEVIAIAEEEVHFEIRTGMKTKPRFFIQNICRHSGAISKEGKYKAPKVIKAVKTVTIVCQDDLSGKVEKAEVKLLPVKIKAGTQPKVFAGGDKVRLEVESLNDKSLDNFTAKITSSPALGKIIADEDGIFYEPPQFVNKTEKIKITATSKRDKTKTAKIEIEVGMAKCSSCKSELGIDNICPKCGREDSLGAYLWRNVL